MTRLVVLAVLVLAALAAADAFRASPKERTVSDQAVNLVQPVAVHRATSGLIAVGVFTRKRVLKDGRAYLSAEEVGDALPTGIESVPFDIAYVASASDGTVALGIYGFPYGGPASSVIQLWRGHRLVNAFRVPSGAFAGGIGFAEEGRLVATLSSDGLLVHLFTRSGKLAGQQPATSW
jgi:hypothetical protein